MTDRLRYLSIPEHTTVPRLLSFFETNGYKTTARMLRDSGLNINQIYRLRNYDLFASGFDQNAITDIEYAVSGAMLAFLQKYQKNK